MFRRKKPLYPVHLRSLGYLGTEREPMTWFSCPSCGYRTLQDSHDENTTTCAGRWAGPHDEVALVVAGAQVMASATWDACSGDPELVRRAVDKAKGL